MRPILIGLAVALILPVSAQCQPVEIPWLFDRVILKNGSEFSGMILKELPEGLHFRCVKRPAGRPTLTFTTYFMNSEIREVQPLTKNERDTLAEKLAALDPDGLGEHARMHELELQSTTWLGQMNGAKMYEADQFILVSSAPDEVTRRAIVRLEQVYAAFTRYIPPQHMSARPTRIELTGDLEQYSQLLKPAAGEVLNPAVFDPKSNRIICGTDLRRVGDDLNRTRLLHLQQLATIKKNDETLRKLYKNQRLELDRHLRQLFKERQKILKADRENDTTFDLATRRLFAILYHEAFHAYTATFVYPKLTPEEIRAGQGPGELPRWLNEGLAQVFESAIVEAGEIRLGQLDPERLKRLQGKMPEVPLLPLKELLQAGQETFFTSHITKQQQTDRAYLTSWALANDLMFTKRCIGNTAMNQYLRSINTGADPITAFETWVGMKLPEYEKELQEAIQKLPSQPEKQP